MAPRRRPKGVQGVQTEPRGMLEASKRRPNVLKKCPGGAKLDLLVFYNVFKRPQSLGGMRGGALITYRFGRLTELKHHNNQPSLHTANTHWSASRHGAVRI